MSDISISSMTMSSMAFENQMQGAESVKSTARESMSGINMGGLDANDQAVAGAEVASRSNDFIGATADYSSTGTDYDFAQAVNTSMQDGIGAIADKVI